jgi:hypothetical protein
MKKSTKSIVLATFGFLSFWILSHFIINRGASSSPSSIEQIQHPPRSVQASTTRFRGNKDKHRIAIVIPFFGESPEAIPSYLRLFCTAAAGSKSLVDFLLIHNGVLEAYTEPTPSNVIFINIGSTQAFAERLVRVVDKKRDLAVQTREQLIKIVTYHIHQYPYVLVEFKPAIAHIFSDLLEGYSHWGYSDLDIAFGDLPRWISEEELTDYDIVTYGYGDQNRLYLRGQFTFHKNDDKINQIWRECDYLSSMDERFAKVMAGKEKLRVESAEGCYSAAVLNQTNIRVKYAVKAFNDIEEKDTANTHGIYLGIGFKRDSSVIYKAETQKDGALLAQLSPTWFQDKQNVYGSKEKLTLQRQVGKRENIPNNAPSEKVKCMYWVPEKYQQEICISGVSSTETVFLIDGKLYKQSFENTKLPGNVVSSPFFHFQEWKRYYRDAQLASVHRSTPARGWVLTKEGAIPLHPRNYQNSKWTSLVSPPLGHNNMKQWSAADNSNRKMLPNARYCLTSAPRKTPPRPVVSSCFHSVSWQDSDRVEILHGAPVWKHIDVKREVTLALTLQITAEQAASAKALDGILDVAIANVNAWQGQPCVLVIFMAGATEESIAIVKARIASLETNAALVALIDQEESHLVSRKALMNMASDAAPTRWVVSGLEVERGLVLSGETSGLAYRRAKIQQDVTGSVFVIPQFAIDGKTDGIPNSLFNDLADMRRTGEHTVHDPDEYNEGCKNENEEQTSNEVFREAHKLWWELSSKETTAEYSPYNDAGLHDLALAFDNMQHSFMKLLTTEKDIELRSLDVSPILMTDSLGPDERTRTSELVREIEEFAGKRCYNGLRLAQLAVLGYNFNILPEAFAISTNASRKAASKIVDVETHGASRCDGCFMFDEKHSIIVTTIEKDERIRLAKTAILWETTKSQSSAVYP